MAFRTVRSRFHIPPGYGQIWQTIVQLPILPSHQFHNLWWWNCGKIGFFITRKSLVAVNTNDVYHKLVKDRVRVQSKVLDTWHIIRGSEWCARVIDAGWKSYLPFRAMVGGLPLARALK